MKKILLTLFILTITSSFIITPTGFTKDKDIYYNLDRLSKQSEKRLKLIDKKLKKQEKEERIRKKLDELNNLYTKAEALYNQGKYKEAKSLYRKITKYTKDPDVRLAAREKKKELETLSKQRMKEEQKLKAEKRKAEKKHLKKGKALYKKRKWNEAITEYQKALAIEPGNKKALRFIKKAKTKLKRSKNK